MHTYIMIIRVFSCATYTEKGCVVQRVATSHLNLLERLNVGNQTEDLSWKKSCYCHGKSQVIICIRFFQLYETLVHENLINVIRYTQTCFMEKAYNCIYHYDYIYSLHFFVLVLKKKGGGRRKNVYICTCAHVHTHT